MYYNDARVKANKLLHKFEQRYPSMVEHMKRVSHGNGSQEHREDTVWAHTLLCLSVATEWMQSLPYKMSVYHIEAQRYKYKDERTLRRLPRDLTVDILLLMSLLHDIGKLNTGEYKESRDKYTFINHAEFAFYPVRDLINDLLEYPFINNGMEEPTRKEIIDAMCIAVALHDLFLTIPANPVEMPKRLAPIANFYPTAFAIICTFVHVDRAGRFYNPTDKIGVQDHLYSENLDHSIKSLKYMDNPVLEGLKTKVNSPTAIMMCGVPGTGKSTIAEILGAQGYSIVSLDNAILKKYCPEDYNKAYNMWAEDPTKDELEHAVMSEIKDLTSKGKNIVIDMTNMSKKTRTKKWHVVPLNYLRKVWMPRVGLLGIGERLALRPYKRIPGPVMTNMRKSFNVPGLEGENIDVVKFVTLEEI